MYTLYYVLFLRCTAQYRVRDVSFKTCYGEPRGFAFINTIFRIRIIAMKYIRSLATTTVDITRVNDYTYPMNNKL